MNRINQLYEQFKKCSKVTTDSRLDVEGSLFFALSGENFDGNRFAHKAIQKGAMMAVVDNLGSDSDSNFFPVENVLITLQKLAERHRKEMNTPLLAITGTNGKTTTKELVSTVLSSEKKIHFTKGNFNNHIGVPLTLLGITKETELAVVEMGANHPGEIKELCAIAHPDYGLLTNIGKAHLEGFGNLQGVIHTKQELYRAVDRNSGLVFVNFDDDLLMFLSEKIRRYTYGAGKADVTGKLFQRNPYLKIKWQKKRPEHLLETHLYGAYNFYNVMAAIAVGNYFNISPENIKNSIAHFTPSNNRSQVVNTGKNTVILDAYNANPGSMSLAVKDFYETHFDNPMVILGDMFELGKEAQQEHQLIVDLLLKMNIEKRFLVGNHFCQTNYHTAFQCFKTTAETMEAIKKHPVKNHTILIKGSRAMQLEQLIKFL